MMTEKYFVTVIVEARTETVQVGDVYTEGTERVIYMREAVEVMHRQFAIDLADTLVMSAEKLTREGAG